MRKQEFWSAINQQSVHTYSSICCSSCDLLHPLLHLHFPMMLTMVCFLSLSNFLTCASLALPSSFTVLCYYMAIGNLERKAPSNNDNHSLYAHSQISTKYNNNAIVFTLFNNFITIPDALFLNIPWKFGATASIILVGSVSSAISVATWI